MRFYSISFNFCLLWEIESILWSMRMLLFQQFQISKRSIWYFLFRIFQSNNEVIHVFPSLNPNLKGNRANEVIHEAFKEHGGKVIARVNEVLHNLDQLNLCVSLIKQTGAYHRRFQGFKPQYFQVNETLCLFRLKNLFNNFCSTFMNHFWEWLNLVLEINIIHRLRLFIKQLQTFFKVTDVISI